MIFVDTWAWVALALKLDQHHQKAKRQHKDFLRTGRPYVTSNFVLSEVIAHLYTTLPAVKAQSYVSSIMTATAQGVYRLVHLGHAEFRQAWLLRQKYNDKPDISFVDFTSMVIMQNLGITQIFTGDLHFLQVGLEFRILP